MEILNARQNNKPAFVWVLIGLLFAILWSSASTATKIGLQVAQPLTIAIMRFTVAAFIMLMVAHVFLRYRLPKGREWRMIAIYGLLNITIYLGLYVLAMKEITAGVGVLAVAINPVFIAFLSVFFLKTKLTRLILFSILLGVAGVVVVAYPLLGLGTVTIKGLVMIFAGMLSYSLAAIYFKKKDWSDLKILTINGWQTFFGGLFLLPFVLATYKSDLNQFTLQFWGPVVWLAVFVSIAAIQCWLWLLKANPVKAGMWLFLCPIFGYIIASYFVGDTINRNTVIGIAMVITALVVIETGKRIKPNGEKEFPITK